MCNYGYSEEAARSRFRDDETHNCSVADYPDSDLSSVWGRRAQQRPSKGQRLPAEKKIFIVYLSRTNNTKAVAEMIQQKVGGRIVALELETPYPS